MLSCHFMLVSLFNSRHAWMGAWMNRCKEPAKIQRVKMRSGQHRRQHDSTRHGVLTKRYVGSGNEIGAKKWNQLKNWHVLSVLKPETTKRNSRSETSETSETKPTFQWFRFGRFISLFRVLVKAKMAIKHVEPSIKWQLSMLDGRRKNWKCVIECFMENQCRIVKLRRRIVKL